MDIRLIRRDALYSALTSMRDYLQEPNDGSQEHLMVGQVLTHHLRWTLEEWEKKSTTPTPVMIEIVEILQ